jgi:PilZ domain
MATLFGSILNRPCSHQFSWPHRLPEGRYYQVCDRCGDQYLYDWATMTRGEKIIASVPRQPQAGASHSRAWVPRARRLSVRKPIFYRQLDHSQFHLGMLRNISESGILLESHPRIPEGASVEMIFEMPQEITGKANSRVLCRGEVVRSACARSGTSLVGIAISGYRFLLKS